MKYVKFTRRSTDTGVEYLPGRVYELKDEQADRWLKRLYCEEATEVEFKAQGKSEATADEATEDQPAKATKGGKAAGGKA